MTMLFVEQPWLHQICWKGVYETAPVKCHKGGTYDARKQVGEKGRVIPVNFIIFWNRGKRITPSFRKTEMFRRKHSKNYYLLEVKVLVFLF